MKIKKKLSNIESFFVFSEFIIETNEFLDFFEIFGVCDVMKVCFHCDKAFLIFFEVA